MDDFGFKFKPVGTATLNPFFFDYESKSKMDFDKEMERVIEEMKAERKKKKKVESFQFKGDLNIRHLCNEMLNDGVKAFIVHGRVYGDPDNKNVVTSTYDIYGIRRDLDKDTEYKDDVAIGVDGVPFCTNSTDVSYPYMFKEVSGDAIGKLKKDLDKKVKGMRKLSKHPERTGNVGHHKTVFTI